MPIRFFNGVAALPVPRPAYCDTATSLLLADGVDLATVSARLGHSSVRTTAHIYSNAIRGKDHAAADDIMGRAPSEREKSKTMN